MCKRLTPSSGTTDRRLRALITTACDLLSWVAPDLPDGLLRRFDKGDTKYGPVSLQPLADLGVPYSVLIYERLLGRPFAGAGSASSR